MALFLRGAVRLEAERPSVSERSQASKTSLYTLRPSDVCSVMYVETRQSLGSGIGGCGPVTTGSALSAAAQSPDCFVGPVSAARKGLRCADLGAGTLLLASGLRPLFPSLPRSFDARGSFCRAACARLPETSRHRSGAICD
jgi:hypothetical protein